MNPWPVAPKQKSRRSARSASNQTGVDLQLQNAGRRRVHLIGEDAIVCDSAGNRSDHRRDQICGLDRDEVSARGDEINRAIARRNRGNCSCGSEIVGYDDSCKVILAAQQSDDRRREDGDRRALVPIRSRG